MKKRVVTKIGDIFSVRINEKNRKYFQLIAFDPTQLNSDVIRAFKKEYPIDADPDLEEIVRGEVEFYAHCVTKWGVKLDYWEKVGTSGDVGDLNNILFRRTEDYGHKEGAAPIRVSDRWYVWQIGGQFKEVGKLNGEHRIAEIGIVVTPSDVVERMKTGKYSFFYPDFE
ncbi:MAG: hypothetical protein KF831_16860 [Acidobacteria bacterium]|nr:hypothetical protein [Acidobacteriota bacterium]